MDKRNIREMMEVMEMNIVTQEQMLTLIKHNFAVDGNNTPEILEIIAFIETNLANQKAHMDHLGKNYTKATGVGSKIGN